MSNSNEKRECHAASSMKHSQEDERSVVLVCPYKDGITASQSLERYDDEIDLIEILSILWKRRILILLIMILFGGASFGYVWSIPKTYDAKIDIYPASDLGIGIFVAKVKLVNPRYEPLTIDNAFNRVTSDLSDPSIQSSFLSQSEVARKLISDRLFLSVVKINGWLKDHLMVNLSRRKQKTLKATVTLSGYDPNMVQELLQDYIAYIFRNTAKDINQSLKSDLAENMVSIQARIDLLKKQSDAEFQQTIRNLNEHKFIAERLNIVEMPDNLADKPIYARGTKAIQAQIDSLMKRKDSALFVEGMSNLIVALETLNDIHDSCNVKVTPAKTRSVVVSAGMGSRKLMLTGIGGMMLGFMVGIVLVFIINYREKLLRQKQSKCTPGTNNDSK